MNIMVPLSRLSLSKYNVRQGSDDTGIDEVIATIKARGVLQNLGVIKARSKDFYEVVYGGRRLRALQLMAERGELAGGVDYEVSCVVRNKATAFDDSLAENVVRLAMHPLDECAAFRRLIDQGSTETDIAERYGISTRQVGQRLRLAGLAPEIASAYRKREITLDLAQAYATTADQALQVRIYEQNKHYRAHPDSIRREIAQAGVAADHRLAVFVGREAYEAAGGIVEDALFTDQITFRDRELLEELANAKAAAGADALRETLGVAEVRLARGGYGGVGPDETLNLKHAQITVLDLSEEQQATHDGLMLRYNELTADGERDSDDMTNDEKAELSSVCAAIDALEEACEMVDAATMATAVAFVVIDDDGQLSRHPQLFVPKTAPELAAAPTGKATATPAATKQAKPFAESAQLGNELADQRGQILAAGLAQSPDLAAEVLAFAIACGVLGTYRRPADDLKLALTAKPASRAVQDVRFDNTVANATLRAVEDNLDLGWLQQHNVSDQFEGFQELSAAAKASIVAFCVARMVEPTVNATGASERCSSFHSVLAQRMSINVADWWRPTSANYWDRATKTVMLEALDDFGGTVLRGRYASEKKGALSATMEQLCAGAAIIEPEVKTRAVAYVPPIMRFGSTDDATDEAIVDNGLVDDGLAETNHDETIDTESENATAANDAAGFDAAPASEFDEALLDQAA